MGRDPRVLDGKVNSPLSDLFNMVPSAPSLSPTENFNYKRPELMKKNAIDPSERFTLKYRPSVFQYELLARQAAMTPHRSMQRVLDERLFSRKSRSELLELRIAQRKLGYKDQMFYPPALLRRLGLKVQRGRHQRRLKTTKTK